MIFGKHLNKLSSPQIKVATSAAAATTTTTSNVCQGFAANINWYILFDLNFAAVAAAAAAATAAATFNNNRKRKRKRNSSRSSKKKTITTTGTTTPTSTAVFLAFAADKNYSWSHLPWQCIHRPAPEPSLLVQTHLVRWVAVVAPLRTLVHVDAGDEEEAESGRAGVAVGCRSVASGYGRN